MMSSIQPLLVVVIVAIFLFDVALCDGEDDATTLSQSNQPEPAFKLRNGVSIPLIGMGIGNLLHESIPQVVKDQLGAGVRVIDTARASNNERILAKAIADLDGNEKSRRLTRGGNSPHPPHPHELEPIHIVTKVWYTMLGYERTKISVQGSLNDLGAASSARQIYVHMLLHWPRCNDDIPWMNCEEEEKNLPQFVRDAGPPPHLNKDGAFVESWKALEEIYLEHQKNILRSNKSGERQSSPLIMSIGVSNFELEDVKQLIANNPTVPPQIYQGNAWCVFHDPYLMDYLRSHGIFFQAYAVMNGILQQKDASPNAYNSLSGLSRELMATVYPRNKDVDITEATVLLAYFIQSGVGVIPRAASSAHQKENSPQSLSAILPHMTPSRIKQLQTAIPALSNGEDMHTSVSFMNALSTPIQIHWVNPDTNEEVLVSNIIHPGSVEVQQSHPGHRFVAYDPDRSIRKEFLVDAPYGERQYFSVEL